MSQTENKYSAVKKKTPCYDVALERDTEPKVALAMCVPHS